ncbi:UNVERIFIED_CONTAM: hypothetical protein HDU68_009048 [Siphonaria sp. JEL0065]|nr:hypothetical protein HDU68_009048 [Siphonaria sp. JEL0065]
MPRIEELSNSDDDMPGLVDVADAGKQGKKVRNAADESSDDEIVDVPGATTTKTGVDNEFISVSDDDMPGLVDAPDVAGSSQTKSKPTAAHSNSDDDSDDDMSDLVEAPTTKPKGASRVIDSDDDSDHDMPGLVDLEPAGKSSRAKTLDQHGDSDSDDEMPELVELDPATGEQFVNDDTNYSQTQSFKPQYGDTSSKFDEAEACCNTAQLHVLDLCSSPYVFNLKKLINERKLYTAETVRVNKQIQEGEARLMDLQNSMTAEEQKREEKLVDDLWEELMRHEDNLLKTNDKLKVADLEFLNEIKKSHSKLQILYGRKKVKGSFSKKEKKSADRMQSERRYQEDNGRRGAMTEEAAANILGLAEIDKAQKTLTNPKFRHKYLVLADDSHFSSKRRTPKYADKSDPEIHEKANAKKEEPVWSLMRRQRTGALQRYGNNSNHIQREIVLEFPTQPTCPEVTVTDNAEGRYVKIAWGVSLSEERAVNKCEVSMRSNGGLWNPIWAGDVNECVIAIEDYGLLSFRIRAHNELGWGVFSYIRDVNILKWKPPVKNTHVHTKKSGASISKSSDVDMESVLTTLKEKISTITAANPDLNSRLRVLSELLGALPATTRHHSHLPSLNKHLATVIQTTEQAIQKQAKHITNQWRIKLNTLTNEILKTADVAFSDSQISKTWSSEFSDLLETYSGPSNTEDMELTSQSKNQIWQAIQGLYMKRPTKLIPTVVINNKQQQQVSVDGTPVIITPGLAMLRKIDRVLQTYVEASDSGVFTVSQTGVKEWAETVSRQVERSIEREEVKADEVVKLERQRIERERLESDERERKEQARVDAELRRRAAAEEKERLLIAKREAKEEEERREIRMREEMERTRLNEVAAREKEALRQRGLEEARVTREEMMRRQTPAYASQENNVQQQANESSAKAQNIRVVRVPRSKASAASLNNYQGSNIDIPSDIPVSVERLDYGVNRIPKFGSHGEDLRLEVRAPSACKFFNTSKGCRNGSNCKNLHIDNGAVAAESDHVSASVPVAGAETAELCKFFNTKIGCKFGDKCRHAHIEGQRPARVNKGPRAKPNGGMAEIHA